MTPIARRFLVASFVYLVLGLVAQTVAALDVWLGFNPLAYTTVMATQQILLIGWLTQAVLALIYDRWLVSPQATDASASGQVVFVLFNIGLPLVIIGRPGLSIFGGPWLGAGAVLGAALQLLAILLFLRQAWLAFRSV